MNILLVEDDVKAARLLARGLEEDGFAVQIANCADAVNIRSCLEQDLIVLDWMLPGKTGIDLCRQLRSQGICKPILMLTARDAVGDRIEGLNTGADDYLTKPFVYEEFLARVRALLRRSELSNGSQFRVSDLQIDVRTHTVMRAGVRIELTPKEYAILELMVQHAGEVVSRQRLAQGIWHADLIGIDNLIDVHMKNLRRKIDPSGTPALIRTIRGQGYCLLPAGESGGA